MSPYDAVDYDDVTAGYGKANRNHYLSRASDCICDSFYRCFDLMEEGRLQLLQVPFALNYAFFVRIAFIQ